MINPLSDKAGYVLRRASSAAVSALTSRLAPLGVRTAEASVLNIIAHNPALTQSELGNQLGIQRANMAPLIARLEDHGWIVREARDRRSQSLALTPAGRTLQAQIWREVERFESELIAAVPEDDRPRVLPILRAIWRQFD